MARVKPYRQNAPIMPGTGLTLRELEAPVKPGYLFLGGTGWLGLQCACGFVVSGRSPGACQDALLEHQTPLTCVEYANYVQAEDKPTDVV